MIGATSRERPAPGWRRIGLAIPLFFCAKLAVGLALIKLSAHFLSVAGFGIFSQFLLFSAFANMLAAGGVQNGLTRQVAASPTALSKRSAVRAALTIWGAISALMLLSAGLFGEEGSVLLTGRHGMGAVVAALVLAATLGGGGQIWGAVLTGSGRGEASLFAQALGLVIGGGGAILALWRGQAIAAVVIFALGPVVASGVARVLMRRISPISSGPVADVRREVLRLLSYAGSFVVTASLMPVTLFATRNVYRGAFGADDLGFWLAANRVSDVTTQLLGLFMAQVLLPTIAGAASDAAGRKFIGRVFVLATIMMGGLLLVFWLGARSLVGLFLSSSYLPAIPYILIYMAGDVIRVSCSIGLYVALATRRLPAYAGLEVLFATVFAVVTGILIRLGQPFAPAIGYLACNVVVAMAVWLWIVGVKAPRSPAKASVKLAVDDATPNASLSPGRDRLKRLVDVVGAATGLVVLSPVLLVVAIMIRRQLGSPALFRQLRPGLAGAPFVMLKFRTMRDVAGPDGAPLSDAERLTSLGVRLRGTSLDELPELWNVLRGEMSLVGPRPLLMRYVDRYTPAQARRQEVRPGITGWAQVNGRNALSWKEKFALDTWYVDHRSFWLDMKILLMTIHRVIGRDGIASPGEATTPEFMGDERSEL